MRIKTGLGPSPTGKNSALRVSKPRYSLLCFLTALAIGGWGHQAAADRTLDNALSQRSASLQSDIQDAATDPIMNGRRLDDGQPLVDWP